MNIFDKSPILRVLEELGASPEGEPSWWADVIARGLEEAANESPDENAGFSVRPSPSRTQ